MRKYGSPPSIPLERKALEKNRRTRMKALFSELASQLPTHSSGEKMSFPDKIHAAAEFIKSMETKQKSLKEKKESLSSEKGSPQLTSTSGIRPFSEKRWPLVDVQEVGSNLDVVNASDLDDYSTFTGIVKLIQENGFQITGANFSITGNSTIHILHDKVRMSEERQRLKQIFCSTSSSEGLEPLLPYHALDSEIEYGFWDSEFLGILNP